MHLKRLFSFCFNLFFTLSSFAASCTKDELVMVQFVFREGSTAPATLYPTDPHPPSIWREGLDDLTMLGKFQSYALGSLLRDQYHHFITSDPREVEVLSSSRPSSVKSALSLVAALYAPTPEWQVVKGLPWQPIYVKYTPEPMDKYLGLPECPGAEEEYERIFATPEAEAFIFKYLELFDYWSVNSGWSIRNWDSAALLYEALEAEQNYNLTVPIWARRYWDELRYMSDMAIHWRLRTKQMQRLRGGPLLQIILDKMRRKVAGELSEQKVVLYSTSSEKVASILSALNVFNGKVPPFSATVAIELYEEPAENFVRFLYLNSTTPEREPQLIHVLVLDGCSEFCPLDYVLNYTKEVIPEDWEAECNHL